MERKIISRNSISLDNHWWAQALLTDHYPSITVSLLASLEHMLRVGVAVQFCPSLLQEVFAVDRLASSGLHNCSIGAPTFSGAVGS